MRKARTMTIEELAARLDQPAGDPANIRPLYIPGRRVRAARAERL